tara:strand:- start:747 stop:1499 length:753 start_codon:yes stop_codon:yes gene_type:complete
MFSLHPHHGSDIHPPFYAQDAHTLFQFLTTPQPTQSGMVTIKREGNISERALFKVLSYQLGAPINQDLTGLSADASHLKDALLKYCKVDERDILSTLSHMCKTYIDHFSDPAFALLTNHETKLVNALQRYAANHARVYPSDIAEQKYFSKLAKYAFLERRMANYAYSNTALLALFTLVPRERVGDALASIDHHKHPSLYLAAFSIIQGKNIIHAAAGGLMEHFKKEHDNGSPITHKDFSYFNNLLLTYVL